MITKYAFEGKMKDGPISKLLITKIGRRPTQYKKITDTLPLLCTDQNYQGINDVIWNKINRVETDFIPIYPNATQWLNTNHVEIVTVNPSIPVDTKTRLRPPIVTLLQKHTSLMCYYQNTNNISKSSLKSTPNSLPTRRP